MIFRGWIKTTLIDYPERVSTLVFTPGCNFRCPYCYNPWLVLRFEYFPIVEDQKILEYLEENRSLYQAVMVTGGEPTMEEELPGFFDRVKELKLDCGLATNGTNPEMLRLLISRGLVDFIAMDIKAPLDAELYQRACGLNAADSFKQSLFPRVLESVGLLLNSGIDYEFRTTMVPGIHREQEILQIAQSLKGAKHFVLQQFVPGNTIDNAFTEAKPYSWGTLSRVHQRIQRRFQSCEVRGR